MKKILPVVCTVVLCCFNAFSQSIQELEAVMKISRRFQDFASELADIAKIEKRASSARELDAVDKRLTSLDANYNLYLQANQTAVASNESLSAQAASFAAQRQELTEALAAHRSKIQAVAKLDDAMKLLARQDTAFQKFLKAADKYSMSKASAKLLEKTKAKAEASLVKVEAAYADACAAIEVVPEMESRRPEMEDNYFEIKSLAAKIAEAAYKPLVQRVKDYLTSFAAVAILLMFLNMLQGRLKAAKQMRENMKKMRESLKKDETDEMPAI